MTFDIVFGLLLLAIAVVVLTVFYGISGRNSEPKVTPNLVTQVLNFEPTEGPRQAAKQAFYFYGKNRGQKREPIRISEHENRFMGRCVYCAKKVTVGQVRTHHRSSRSLPKAVCDHVIPWIYGGEDDKANIFLACDKCNGPQLKHDKLTFFARELVFARGKEIADRSGMIIPYSFAKECYLASPYTDIMRPWFLFDTFGRPVLLENFKYTDLIGLPALLLFLDVLESQAVISDAPDWRERIDKITMPFRATMTGAKIPK